MRSKFLVTSDSNHFIDKKLSSDLDLVTVDRNLDVSDSSIMALSCQWAHKSLRLWMVKYKSSVKSIFSKYPER